MRCLGLISMLPGGSEADAAASSQRLALLRTALAFDSSPVVRGAAAEAVCDLALSRCDCCPPPPDKPLTACCVDADPLMSWQE